MSGDFFTDPLPAGIDPEIPSIARIYDYWLGGAHNFASDREFGEKALTIVPGLRDIAIANRQFLIRATRLLASDYGVSQFLDIGCGLPATSSVHEVAQAVNPAAQTVYVDNDPVAVAHGESLLASDENATIVQADLFTPERILRQTETKALISTGLPTAVLVVAVLHFVSPERDPVRLLSTLLEPFPSGSFLVFSHGTADADPQMNALGGLFGERSTRGGVSRTHAEQLDLLGRIPSLELIEPGLVWTASWRPDPAHQAPRLLDAPERSNCYAAVGMVK
jgi:hypothetical protein